MGALFLFLRKLIQPRPIRLLRVKGLCIFIMFAGVSQSRKPHIPSPPTPSFPAQSMLRLSNLSRPLRP